MGYCPDWYVTMRAARYIGCNPWELIDQPRCWTEWALAAETAETEAKQRAEKRAASRSRRR